MTALPPPGWYPDPSGSANTKRWWDGHAWTRHVQFAPSTPQAAPKAEAPPNYAHWGWRVLSWIVDHIIVTMITTIVGWSVINQMRPGFAAWQQDLFRVLDRGVTAGLPSPYDDTYGLAEPLQILVFINLMVFLFYTVILIKNTRATLGMKLARLEVRSDRAPEEPLPLIMVLLRQTSFGLFTSVMLLNLINFLMPLWSKKRQALHDWMAKTTVIKKS